MADDVKAVLHHNGLGFLMIRKCATTSIKVAMLEGMGHERQPSIHRDSRLQYCTLEDAKPLKLVAVIRNPYERLVSAWRNKMHDQADHPGADRFKALGVQPGCTFTDFVKQIEPYIQREGHIRPQHKHLPARVEYMIRFEALEYEWSYLQKEHSWLPGVGHFNQSVRDDFFTYYDEPTFDKVTQLYKTDIDLSIALSSRQTGTLRDVRWTT